MIDQPRIQQLLDQLQESQATPEEVCSSCPELLPEVRERWQRICRVRNELDALFPTPSVAETPSPTVTSDNAALPQVSGYEVMSVLGRGGMGVVFLARHTRLKRLVALKMALAGAYAGRQERERFQREARAMAGLGHPNVVQVFDVGDHDGQPYFTMEHIEGGSLAHKLDGTPLPNRRTAELLGMLSEAVQAAHECGIIHRDLKPANVLLTSDGTPKITDFGLARRVEGEAGLTWTGIALGTPSYMAPEQAEGTPQVPGPAVDIYALGAVLYELLTGRPPFRAESAAETFRQAISQEPVPPSRLNGKVPRDLETICLKCLQKEPNRRYASALALADDLHRFLRGESIRARPEGLISQLLRRVRRRPALSAAIAISSLLFVALTGGGLWTFADREKIARDIEAERLAVKRSAEAELVALEGVADADLVEMEESMTKCRWPEATAALERAKSRLGDRGSPALHERIERGERDLKLVARWDAIRLDGYLVVSDAGPATTKMSQSDRDFEEAFREAGFGQIGDNAEVVAERIRSSPLRNFLVAELDYWAAVSETDKTREKWLQKLAQTADTAVTAWRRRAAISDNWNEESSIAALIDTAPAEYPPILILINIEKSMIRLGRDPVPLMKRFHQSHTNDLWLNFKLGEVLMMQKKPEEAIRFYQAALAIRPKTAILCNNIGAGLFALKRYDEAEEQYRRALEYAPRAGMIRVNLCDLLSRLGRHDEALEQGRIALDCEIQIPSAKAMLHTTLGISLKAKGREGDAFEAFQKAAASDPTYLPAQLWLRDILMKQGKWEEARAAWEKALAANPPEYDAWSGYVELCLFLGNAGEYQRVCPLMLNRFEKSATPQQAETIGRACLLAPLPEKEALRAATLIDRALAADKSKSPTWIRPYFLLAKALGEYRLGRFDSAITLLDGEPSKILVPAPQLILAVAQFGKGQKEQARKTLGETMVRFDWRTPNANGREAWIYHILRREAENLILPNLPAFLEGKYRPEESDERLAFLPSCVSTNRTLALAKLYSDGFADDPQRPWDLSGHRLLAARAAAMVGAGRGIGASGLSEPERLKWREQSRQWLRTSLGFFGKLLDSDSKSGERVRNAVKAWREDPDLASLRDPIELRKLSEDEQRDCTALWKEVDELLLRAREMKPLPMHNPK